MIGDTTKSITPTLTDSMRIVSRLKIAAIPFDDDDLDPFPTEVLIPF